ncbi:MAG: Bax inhibitor-1/YccA family protein [Acidobacteria bacterium]|nr:Bax inhibitor-1/YccA family protein [Acidobacteriota bacterium]
MRTSNPALTAQTFVGVPPLPATMEAMTIQGTVNRTGILLVLAIAGASITWNMFWRAGDPSLVMPWMIGGALGGFVVALVTVFKKEWAGVTAPIYAIVEGLFLGAISGVFEAQFKGIVIQAVGLTLGTLFALLMAYKSGLIKATENFKLGVVAATGGIALLYLASMVMGFFGARVPYIHESGAIGIAFSLFVVVVAALNLVLDFDFIENGTDRGAPKYMEWYAAFGLMVTLIWLYIEFLRLLAKARSRR